MLDHLHSVLTFSINYKRKDGDETFSSPTCMFVLRNEELIYEWLFKQFWIERDRMKMIQESNAVYDFDDAPTFELSLMTLILIKYFYTLL